MNTSELQRLDEITERRCSFNCDAESNCTCTAHLMRRELAAALLTRRDQPERELSIKDLQMVASVFTDVATEKAESEDPDCQAEAPELRALAIRADKQAFDLSRKSATRRDAPQEQHGDSARVAPLKAGDDGQDLPQSGSGEKSPL